MKYEKMVRQGDVLLVRLDKEDPELDEVPKDERGIVLAEGETSGHYHQVFGTGVKLFRYRGAESAARVLVVAREGAELRVVGGDSGGVARHLPIPIAPGKWEVRIQRSWTAGDEERSRQVAD